MSETVTTEMCVELEFINYNILCDASKVCSTEMYIVVIVLR